MPSGLTLGWNAVRRRGYASTPQIAVLAADASVAHHQAVIALGKAIKHQALVMGFSDTFWR
jgi:MFS transporter, DHA2 family, multidrug resistance protein